MPAVSSIYIHKKRASCYKSVDILQQLVDDKLVVICEQTCYKFIFLFLFLFTLILQR